jgi:hypothetical protein
MSSDNRTGFVVLVETDLQSPERLPIYIRSVDHVRVVGYRVSSSAQRLLSCLLLPKRAGFIDPGFESPRRC